MADVFMGRSVFNALPPAEQGAAVRDGVKVVDTLPAGRKAWTPPARKTMNRNLFEALSPVERMTFIRGRGQVV